MNLGKRMFGKDVPTQKGKYHHPKGMKITDESIEIPEELVSKKR